tara:strand:- start:10691 stop:11986 length:1296 start_codon:yes stop_codon:yes gene_type:complete
MKKYINKKLSLNSKFTKNVVTLVTGTALSQAIPLALAPILTRLYTPEDFGVLATYMSIAAVATVVVSLKYDIAIIIPEKDLDSASITILSIILAFIVSLVLFILLIFYNTKLAEFLIEGEEAKVLAKWLFFIPLSVFFTGVFNAVSFWFNRKSFYKTMAVSKVVNTSGMTGLQIGLGFLNFTPLGLLIGFLAGRFFSMLYLLNKLKKDKDTVFSKVNRKGMLYVLNRYKRFPYFTLPAEFTNVISNQLPIFIIGKYFGGVVLGNYSLMERVLNAPISLLGRSVLDVFKQRASEDYAKLGNCKEIFVKTTKTLVVLSIVPTLLLFLLSPLVFEFIFGEEWYMAGEFAQIFSILFFFKFTASPLSYMFNIAEKQHYDMFWQIGLFVFAIISFIVGVQYNDVKIALICFVVTYSLMYLLNIYLSYSFAKGAKVQ